MFICCINLSKHSCINFSERYRGSMIGLAGLLNATVYLCRRKYFAQAARLLFQASGFLFPLPLISPMWMMSNLFSLLPTGLVRLLAGTLRFASSSQMCAGASPFQGQQNQCSPCNSPPSLETLYLIGIAKRDNGRLFLDLRSVILFAISVRGEKGLPPGAPARISC